MRTLTANAILSMDLSQVSLGGIMFLCHRVISLIKSESMISEQRTSVLTKSLWSINCGHIQPGSTHHPPPHPLSFLRSHSLWSCLSLSALLILHFDVRLAHRRMLLFCIIWFLGLQLYYSCSQKCREESTFRVMQCKWSVHIHSNAMNSFTR